jgi:hypothetical protein
MWTSPVPVSIATNGAAADLARAVDPGMAILDGHATGPTSWRGRRGRRAGQRGEGVGQLGGDDERLAAPSSAT